MKCPILDTKSLKKGVSLEEELFNEDVIRLNSKSPENTNFDSDNFQLQYSSSNIHTYNPSNNDQTSIINESFEASLASSTCGESSENGDEDDNDVEIDIDFNQENSIKDTVRM